MLTDYDEGPPCRHRWHHRCWLRDLSGESQLLRWRLEVCRLCGAVRITHYAGRFRMHGYSYAESMEEALLGRPYALPRLQPVLHN
jgi:hypothetical protein